MSEAEYLAYSTLAGRVLLEPLTQNFWEWFRNQNFESGEQKIAVDRNMSYGLVELCFPVCRRKWMIKTARQSIDKIKADAKQLAADEREELLTDIAVAMTCADRYGSNDAVLLAKEWELDDDLSEQEAEELADLVKTVMAKQRDIEADVNKLKTPARETFRQLLFINSVQSWIDSDRRAGLPVDQFEYSDVLEELANKDRKVTFDQRLDRLPLGIRNAYQMGAISQSDGGRSERMGIAIASRGYYPPSSTPEAPKKRRWGLAKLLGK